MSKDLLRSSQVITTFGPGAMVDLPDWSVIIGGLDHWDENKRRKIIEHRLLPRLPDPSRGLATPPLHDENPYSNERPGLEVFVFPTWFLTAEGQPSPGHAGRHRRRLVRFGEIDARKRTFEGKPVVPVRFVAACEAGHVEDVDWKLFVHRGAKDCDHPLWLEESGASGDVKETWVCCGCGDERPLYDALGAHAKVLGPCRGRRPWLGPDASEPCDLHKRLLVRTASNAYFPVLISVLSIPQAAPSDLQRLVETHWDDLHQVTSPADLANLLRFNSAVRNTFAGYDETDLLRAIQEMRDQPPSLRPDEFAILKGHVSAPLELADPTALLATEPLDRGQWDPDYRFPQIEKVVLVHRLREVLAQIGFTRFEPVTSNPEGELDLGVRSQKLSNAPWPYPAIELYGEGIFLAFDEKRLRGWMANKTVRERSERLEAGFQQWRKRVPTGHHAFPGVAYVALHTLSHLLLAEIALDCGYPLAALRERIYALPDRDAFGVLVYTASSGSGGTLGGLVEAGKRIGDYLERALERARLCSSDPICAEHDPSLEGVGNPLSGAACHGCVLVPESSCENRNDFLDRALLVETLADKGVALFQDFGGGSARRR
ncbi:MAG TPA: DUF1998 domain-containing protein [Rhodospirillales bacterium]|nr:DUF1998 domain-containing protein [Rhodospirillales bacterium]